MRKSGLAKGVIEEAKKGKTIIGICGGYQMMGIDVADPDGVEGDIKNPSGTGLLPVHTVLSGEKVTRPVKFKFLKENEVCEGYEIHMGVSSPEEGESRQPTF